MHLPTVNVRFAAEDLNRKKKDDMNTFKVRVKRVAILMLLILVVTATYLLIAQRRKPGSLSEESSENDGVQLMQKQRILVESKPKFKGMNVPRIPSEKTFALFRKPGRIGQNDQHDQNVGQDVSGGTKLGEDVGNARLNQENQADYSFGRDNQLGDFSQNGQGGEGGEAVQAPQDRQSEIERRLHEQQELIRQQAHALQQLQDQLQGGVRQPPNDLDLDPNFQKKIEPVPGHFQGNFPQDGRLPERNFPQGPEKLPQNQEDFPNRQDNFLHRNFPQGNVHEPQRLFPQGAFDGHQNFPHGHLPPQQDSKKQVIDAARMFESARNNVLGQNAVKARLQQQEANKAEPTKDKDAAKGPLDAEKLFAQDRLKGLRKPSVFANNKYDGRRYPQPLNAPELPQGKRNLGDSGQNVNERDELGPHSAQNLQNELNQIRSDSKQDLPKRIVDHDWAIPPTRNPMNRQENNALAKYFAGMARNNKLDRYDGEKDQNNLRNENQENGFKTNGPVNDLNLSVDTQNDDEFEDMPEDEENSIANQEVTTVVRENFDSMVDQNLDSGVHGMADSEANQNARSGPRIHVYELSEPPNGLFDCVPIQISHISRKICVHPQEKDMEQSHNIILRGKWEEHELELLRRTLKADWSLGLVDIGAGLGVYTLSAIMEGRQVLAVEPFKDNYRLLHKTIQINSGINLVTLVTDALGEKAGIGRFIYPLHDMGAVHVKPLELTQVREDLVSSLVSIVTLDDLVTVTSLKRAILKLDTHGDENLILRGAEKFLQKIDIPYIFMHWLPQQTPAVFTEVAARLKQMGYDPVDDPTGRQLTEQELSHDTSFIVWRKKWTS